MAARIYYADLWGLRGDWPNPQQGTKYYALAESDIASTDWCELQPNSPFYFFVPRNEDFRAEYELGWKVTEIFPTNCVGLFTARDALAIQRSPEEVENTIHKFVALSAEEARNQYELGNDVRDWKVSLAQKDIIDTKLDSKKIVRISYRPFDNRYTYYTGHSRGFHCRPRGKVMHHMLTTRNLGLITNRQIMTGTINHIFITNNIMDLHVIETAHASAYLFPLYLYPAESEMQFEKGIRRPNLNADFIRRFSEKLGLEFIEAGKGDLEEKFGPEDIFNYAYAVLHSPAYRSRYAEFLKIDFPRLPLTSDRELFKALVTKGAELVSIHLMESVMLARPITRYPVTGSNHVEKVRYDEANQRVYINKNQYFEGVSSDIWDFHIGGYQVCHKWLKDRKGRTLSYDELTHYQRIIVALKETICLMQEIDALIPSWPIE